MLSFAAPYSLFHSTINFTMLIAVEMVERGSIVVEFLEEVAKKCKFREQVRVVIGTTHADALIAPHLLPQFTIDEEVRV